MTTQALDDQRIALLHDAVAAVDGAVVAVALRRRTARTSRLATWPAELSRPRGWRRPALLYPVLGALGTAAIDRIATACRTADLPVVVVAATIGPELRRALVDRGFGYLDLAGNCHLALDEGKVVVHVEGRRRAERVKAGGSLRAAGYQVLFSLLADPQLLERSVRDIGVVAGTSRHAVHSLIARLRDEGLLHRAGRSQHVFAPGGREQCIDRLTGGWADVLRDRLLVGRFRLREQDPDAAVATVERVFRAARVPFGFGGAQGAARWLRYLQGDDLVVHAQSFDARLAKQLGAVPDRSGPLTVFRTMTPLDLAAGIAETAHPLLVHAELARSPNPRSREAAALLLEEVQRVHA